MLKGILSPAHDIRARSVIFIASSIFVPHKSISFAFKMADDHNRTPQRSSSLKWNPNIGGRREGAGRPKIHVGIRAEREICIAIPRNLHNTWVNYKRLCGCRTDGYFVKYLLELAEKDM